MQEVFRVELEASQPRSFSSQSRLWVRPFLLDLFHLPAYRCVAWSADNLIAYSAVNTAFPPTEPSYNGAARQALYITSANVPERHAALTTPHRSPIRFLEWAPTTLGGSMLISADTTDMVCVWEMKDSVSDWDKAPPFHLDSTVCVKWLNNDLRYTLPTPAAAPIAVPLRNLEEKFLPERNYTSSQPPLDKSQAPVGIPSFLHVSASGKLQVNAKKLFDERWSSVTGRLPLTNFVICRADITRNAAGTLLLAAAGSFGIDEPAICLFELSIDHPKNVCAARLVSSTLVNDLTPASALNPFSLVHLAFDPASYGQSILTVSCGMARNAKPVLIRWNCALSTAELSNVWDEVTATIPLAATFARPSSQSMATTTEWWSQSARVVVEPDESDNREEESDQLPGLFVTTLHHAPGRVFLGYLNGRFETRDSSTLQVLHSSRIRSDHPHRDFSPLPRKLHTAHMDTNQKAPQDGEELLRSAAAHLLSAVTHENGFNNLSAVAEIENAGVARLELPLSVCISPNGTCVALIHASGALSVHHLGPLVLSSPPSSQQELVKFIADMMELAVVRMCDWWDILVWLCLGPFSHHDIQRVMVQLMMDISGLDVVASRFYGIHLESLKTASFMAMGGEETLYADGVMRQTVVYLHDILPLMLDLDSKTSTQLDNLMSSGGLLNPPTMLFKPEPQALEATIPLADWSFDLILFIQKNVQRFASMNSSQLNQEGLLTPSILQTDRNTFSTASSPLSSLTPLGSSSLAQSLLSLPLASPLCRRLPTISLLLDRKFLETLQRVAAFSAMVMHCYQQQHPTQSSATDALSTPLGSYSLKEAHILYNFVTVLLTIVREIVDRGVPMSPLEVLLNLHRALQGTSGQQALDNSMFTGPGHDPRRLLRRLSLLPLPFGILHRICTKREVELIEGFREATPGEAEKGGAKEDLKEVELQWKKKSSAPSAPHPAAAVTPSSLFSQQRLQGRHDVLTGLALDSAATLQLRQCTRCGRLSGWHSSATADKSATSQSLKQFSVGRFCCPLCAGRWCKVAEK